MDNQIPIKNKKVNLTQSALSYFTKSSSKIDEKFKNTDFYTCKKCGHEFNGHYIGNLSKHLKLKHADLFNEICNNDSIDQKRLKLLLDCVEFVAIDGNTFSKLGGSGLLSMISKTLNELKKAGRSIDFKNTHFTEVKEMLKEVSIDVRRKIRIELHNRPFSMMVDITTKNRRSILGVSAQLIKNGEHIIRSLGMLKLIDSHTGEYLAIVICELLSKYGVKIQQVISTTTDNGANVLKMVREMASQMTFYETNIEVSTHDNQNEANDQLDMEIETYLLTVPDYTDCTDQEILDLMFEQADSDDDELQQNANTNLISSVLSNIQMQPGADMCEITSIRCAAHTAQLGIKKVLNQRLSRSLLNLIAICRRVAKKMRLESTIYELDRAKIEYSIPHLDVETRWCSTYSMVNKHIDIFFQIRLNFVVCFCCSCLIFTKTKTSSSILQRKIYSHSQCSMANGIPWKKWYSY